MTIQEFQQLPIEKQLIAINNYGSNCYGCGTFDCENMEWGEKSNGYPTFEDHITHIILKGGHLVVVGIDLEDYQID